MKLFLFVSDLAKGPYCLLTEPLSDLQQYDLKTIFCLLLAALLASVGLLFILILYIRRIVISARDNKINKLKFKYQYLIYEALVESQRENGVTAQQFIVEKLKKEISKAKLHKQVLIDLIIDLKKNFSGDSEQQFVQLYQSLHLSQYSLKKLDNRRWDVQAKGIRELTEMDHDRFATQLAITSLRYARNPTVAQEAQIASVRMEKNPLFFLADLESPLTEWQQINLHHLLLKVNRKFIPNFRLWLSSPNESVVLFALRMIADFEQKQAEPKVIQCLFHQSVHIREEAIQTLIKLEAKNALPQVIEVCQSCHKSSYLQMLKAVTQWGDSAHITLIAPLLEHPYSEINQAAQYTIAKLKQTIRGAGTSPETASNSI